MGSKSAIPSVIRMMFRTIIGMLTHTLTISFYEPTATLKKMIIIKIKEKPHKNLLFTLSLHLDYDMWSHCQVKARLIDFNEI